MTTIALVGNGEFIPCATLLKTYDVVIALDGGYAHCQRLGIQPQHTLGDADSIQQRPDHFETIPDQTTTDLQKGIQYAQQHYPDCVMDAFCVTSHQRLDHTLAALLHPSIRTVYTPYQKITRVADQAQLVTDIDTTVSIVDIAGCQWSGNNIVLDSDHSGVSNRSTSHQVTVRVQSGKVLVIADTLWT